MTEAMVDAAAAGARRPPGGEPADGRTDAAAAFTGGHARDAVDWWTDRLVDAGELEAAVVDALSPTRDGLPPAALPLRRLSLAAARGLAAAHRAARARTAAEAERDAAAIGRAHARLAAAAHVAAVAVRDAAGLLDDEVAVPVSAGFADAGLFPETYAAAARQLAARVGPSRALVLGVRGTGAGLSAVVADTLARRGVEVRSVTVRARADAADGALAADAALDALLRAAAATPGTWAAVVDEGADADDPAFAALAAALAARGFDAGRIAVFPSWDAAAGADAGAPAGRGAGPRRFVASFDDVVLAAGGVRCHVVESSCRLDEPAGAADAAGRPRLGARVFECAADHGGDGPIRLTFAGLGRYGRERADAAVRRAAAGEGPRVLGFARGYLVTAADAAPGAAPPGAAPAGRPADRAD
jgi:hypothetical protein